MNNSEFTHNSGQKTSWSMVVAASSKEVLQANLLRSEEAKSAKEIFVHWHAQNAAKAFNSELARCTGDVVVMAHQDVYLPKGWAEKMIKSIEVLSDRDPKWAVAGCFGTTASGKGSGILYSSGLKRFVGEFSQEPVQVRTLDEVLLILNLRSELQFDEKLPGFHLYGTDICLEAEQAGMNCYVIPSVLLHNSKGINFLPLNFWKAYLYLRKKWRHRLPVTTPCTRITFYALPIVEDIIRSIWVSVIGKDNAGNRLSDPEKFYNDWVKPKVDDLDREIGIN
jgi:Glycosyltransferase like family